MGTCLGVSEEKVRPPLQEEGLVEHHPKIPRMGECQQIATNHCFRASVDCRSDIRTNHNSIDPTLKLCETPAAAVKYYPN